MKLLFSFTENMNLSQSVINFVYKSTNLYFGNLNTYVEFKPNCGYENCLLIVKKIDYRKSLYRISFHR